MRTRLRKTRRLRQKGGQGLSVKFAGRNANGTRRARGNTLSAPHVSFGGKGLYTLLMWDPDAPAASWLHWLITNIPDGRITDGDVVVGYAPPSPPSGEHRYFVSVYKQAAAISVGSPSGRGNFNVEAFVSQNNLVLLGEKMIKVKA
jgi:phosphatidylethanolamine-binding protein (PEBP) family uncharacterized protein